MITLPFVPSVPFYTFTTTIEDAPYNFNVRWNTRDAAWYFDVTSEDGTVLREGVKVVLGAFLGRACTLAFFEKGVLVARDSTDAGIDAKFDDIGTRVQVFYMTALELRAMLDGEVTI